MPTTHVQADVSVDTLLKAAEQLGASELRRFASQVLALSAKRSTPSVPKPEAELLLRINQGLPAEVQSRYDELIAKRDAETLSTEEHHELLRLTREAEAFDTERVQALTELATIRGVTLSEMMRELQIESTAND